ncbi:hypothetical protein LEMLEM_LOCUS23728 [Lemmus lemmus]
MKRVEEIKQKQQAKFIMNRLKKTKSYRRFRISKKSNRTSILSGLLLQAKESSWRKKWYSSYRRMWTWRVLPNGAACSQPCAHWKPVETVGP